MKLVKIPVALLFLFAALPLHADLITASQIQAVIYSDGTFQFLPIRADGFDPKGIDDSGDVVGWDGQPRWSYTYNAVDQTFTQLQISPNAFFVRANGIDNGGRIVGFDAEYGVGFNAFLDDHGLLTHLSVPIPGAITTPMGINDAGDVVGYYDAAYGRTGFLYHNGQYSSIGGDGSAAGTRLFDINSAGHVLGQTNGRAFIYADGVYNYLDLPCDSDQGIAFNDAEVITGICKGTSASSNDTNAFIYDHGKTTILSDQTYAYRGVSINNNGQVLLRAEPLPEPASAVLLVIGLTAVLVIKKKGEQYGN